jgi:UMF1 family MFS transporter
MQTASKKVVNGWAMYDWANSVYNLVITSTIFPAYFEAITGDGVESTTNDTVTFMGRSFVNTSLYNYALAIAFLIVAIISPILSSIADFRGNKKSCLRKYVLFYQGESWPGNFKYDRSLYRVLGQPCLLQLLFT